MNPYGYVGGNPETETDPSGRAYDWEQGGTGGGGDGADGAGAGAGGEDDTFGDASTSAIVSTGNGFEPAIQVDWSTPEEQVWEENGQTYVTTFDANRNEISINPVTAPDDLEGVDHGYVNAGETPQDRVEEPNGVRPEETEPQPPKSPQSPDSQPPAEHVPPPAEHPQPAEKQPPVNSKGEPYPTVIDPRTFQPIPFPDDLVKTEPENRVDWGSEQRGNFIKEWIEQGYPDYGKEGWKMFDIHHIKPREWGGTNDFWNLVPIDRFWHNRVVTPWWDAYKP